MLKRPVGQSLPDLDEPRGGVWDLAVLGAGVAGCLVAGLAARQGLKVVLLEKESWPRTKVCGSCLNRRGWSVLLRHGVDSFLADGEVTDLDQMILRGKRHRVEYSLPPGKVIARHHLDDALAAWAIAAGVVFSPQTLAQPQIDSQETLGSEDFCRIVWERRDRSGELRARMVVGAWGLGASGTRTDSPLSPSIEEGSRLGVGAILAPLPSGGPPPGSLLMVVRETGYVGVVRLADASIDVAAALDRNALKPSGGPGKLVASILRDTDRDLAEACESIPWKGTPPLTRKAGAFHQGRCFLVGDACGYVEPFTGEGMTWALIGAEALAPLLVEAQNAGFALPVLEALGRRWTKTHGKLIASRQGVCKTLVRGLRSATLTEMGIGGLGVFPRIGTWTAAWLARL